MAAVMASSDVSNRVLNLPSTGNTEPSIGIILARIFVGFSVLLLTGRSFVVYWLERHRVGRLRRRLTSQTFKNRRRRGCRRFFGRGRIPLPQSHRSVYDCYRRPVADQLRRPADWAESA